MLSSRHRRRSRALSVEILESRHLLTGEIEGFVWHDWNRDGHRAKPDQEYRITDVTVNLLSQQLLLIDSTVTDKTGLYRFSDVVPGEYLLEFAAPEGTTFTVPSAADETKDSDADPSTGRTDSFALGLDEKIDNLDAGVFAPLGTWHVGGRAWNDLDADGIMEEGEPGVLAEVQLENIHGEKLIEVMTAEDGTYIIPGEGLLPGDYVLDFVKPAADGSPWQISPQHAREDDPQNRDSDANIVTGKTDVFTLPVMENDAARDRVELCSGFFRSAMISGSVWHDVQRNGQRLGELGVLGYTVRLLDSDRRQVAETVTDRAGQYTLIVPEPGQYSVKFELPEGVAFAAVAQPPEGASSHVDPTTGETSLMEVYAFQVMENLSVGVYSPLGTPSIRGRVWHDVDADGFQDDGEVGVAGAEVQLENEAFVRVTRVTTDGSGAFLMDGANLLPATYHVDFKARPGWMIRPSGRSAHGTKKLWIRLSTTMLSQPTARPRRSI